MSGPTIVQVDAALRAGLAEVLGSSGERTFDGVVVESLFSLRHLARWSSRELCLGPRTVITPLAREELKRRGITIRRISEGELSETKRRGTWGFAMEFEN